MRHPDGMAAGGIPGVRHPDGMAAEEFRMRYVWMEWRRRRNPGVRYPEKVE